MPTGIAEYITKIQDESLALVKQAQDANLAALASASEFGTKIPSLNDAKIPSIEGLPTPAQFVAMSFDFATRFLELRKEYALKVTEAFVAVQKDATQATVRAMQTAATSNN
ncbi:MAG: hypothetical protein ACREM8_07405 [Vulcanimicrobiaceae bacterium]